MRTSDAGNNNANARLRSQNNQIREEIFRDPDLAETLINAMMSEHIGDPAALVRGLLFKSMLEGFAKDGGARLRLVEEALHVSRKYNLRIGEADALRVLGAVHADNHNSKQALECLNASLKLAHENDHQLQIAQAHNSLGIMYSVILDIEQAVKHFRQALKTYEAVGELSGLTRSHANLAKHYLNVGQIDNAINHQHESLRYAEEASDAFASASAISALGELYMKQGDVANAVDYCERSLRLAEKFPDALHTSTTHARLALAQARLNNRPAAEKHLKIGLNCIENGEEDRGVDELWTYCAATLVQLGRKSEARDLYLRAARLHKEGTNQGVLEEIHEGLARLFAEEGDIKRAFHHQQTLSELREEHRNRLVQQAMNNAESRRDVLDSERELNSESGSRNINKQDHLLERLVLSQARSNKMIQSIHAELEKELPQTRGQARRIAKDTMGLIQRVMSENQDLPQIDNFLAEEHEEFVSRLSKRCPVLTPTEMRVCILISLNLRSKEIADSMYVSLETIKSHRKSVRSKLKLPAGTNLTTYLINMATTAS